MKVKNTDEKVRLRGVDFPKGKTVDLTDNPNLAAKVLNLPQFVEVCEDNRK